MIIFSHTYTLTSTLNFIKNINEKAITKGEALVVQEISEPSIIHGNSFAIKLTHIHTFNASMHLKFHSVQRRDKSSSINALIMRVSVREKYEV